MAGFRIVRNIIEAEGEDLPVSSQTLSPGDLIERTNGSTTWAATTSSTNFFTEKAIVDQTVTSSATTVHAFRLNGFEKVAVEVTNTANAAHNGDFMVLTDKNTVNNTGTTSSAQTAVFVQEGVLGTGEIVGRVIVGNGVDPDAT
jgi:hypothetical protein